MLEAMRHALTTLGVNTAHRWRFSLSASTAPVGYHLFERETFRHAVATMATWFMTLFIQRAEHRDTQAIQAKLDELLHAHARARNELTH